LNIKAVAAANTQAADDDGLDQSGSLVVTLAVAMLLLVALVGGALLRKRFNEKELDSGMKEDPSTPSSDDDAHFGSGAVADETVDMQSPMASVGPPTDLQTVEII
jgi:hypothetical protein